MAYTWQAVHQCSYCEAHHCVDVLYGEKEFRERLQKWQSGGLIQEVFPELNSEQREIIMSGTCNDGWNEMFGDEDAEEGSGLEKDELPF